MPDPVGEKYQLAGFDARERGFNRPVEFIRTSSGYQATLRYESSRVITPEAPSPTEALQQLVLLLQRDGYTQLRSQQSYRNGLYLGSQELWVEYPDRPPVSATGIVELIRKWFKGSST